MKTDDRSRDGAQAIHRAAALLREVASFRGPGVNLTQLARSLGLSRGTAHRILAALTQEGFLEKEGALYRLGPIVSELGLANAPLREIVHVTQPVLQALAMDLKGYAAVNLRSSHEAVCIDYCDHSPSPRKLPMTRGNRRPLGVGSASLAILSQLPQDEILQIILHNEHRYKRYRMSADQVLEAANRVKMCGYAVSTGRFVPGYRGVSIGFLIEGSGFGAVTISKPALQLTPADKDRVLDRLRVAGRALSSGLTQLQWGEWDGRRNQMSTIGCRGSESIA